MEKILFVEDNTEYRENITQILKASGYKVMPVPDAISAMEVFVDMPYDLILSDLQMEGMDGIRFLKYAKKINPAIKTIILTGQADPESELEAINIDIDRYLRKDIRLDVLLKYIETVLESPISATPSEEVLVSTIEDLIVNISKQQVLKKGIEANLTHKEFEILVYFLRNKEYVISREKFIEEIWEPQYEIVDLRVIDSHIKLLRKKLQLISIKSIRGYGYKWDE